MRERGRISIVPVAGIVTILLVAVIFLFSKESPSEAASNFMDALVRGDTAKLTELSYMEKQSPDVVKAKWQHVFDNVAKYYRFKWRLISHKEQSEDRAAVSMFVEKDYSSPQAYEQKFELPMVKDQGKWKVDVPRISREMFPGLPR